MHVGARQVAVWPGPFPCMGWRTHECQVCESYSAFDVDRPCLSGSCAWALLVEATVPACRPVQVWMGVEQVRSALIVIDCLFGSVFDALKVVLN